MWTVNLLLDFFYQTTSIYTQIQKTLWGDAAYFFMQFNPWVFKRNEIRPTMTQQITLNHEFKSQIVKFKAFCKLLKAIFLPVTYNNFGSLIK